MNAQHNKETIQAVYAAFSQGDVLSILEKLTDDVHWVSHFDKVVPWGGDFSGKDRVSNFFEAIFQSVDVEAFEPKEWIVENDTVVSLGDFGCRVRQTGKSARTRWVFVWKFRDGQICSYEQFHDPAIAEAFR